MELHCLALLVFFGTLLVLPQASVGTTRYYTFNVRLNFF
jgi:laccase